MMSAETKEFVVKTKLGFVSSVLPDGKPHLSHKGTLTVYDDQHLIFADIASSQTIKQYSEVVIEVVDFFSRKGFRFTGKAQVIPQDANATDYVSFYESQGLSDIKNRVHNFVLVRIESVQETFSPVSSWGTREPEMKDRWKSHYNNLWKF
ncbi:hypothetical protein WSM22_02570 [Cytophagales bacterium WSM2-2]|nr:hypothetical protein WSM22_02570 [Cytophagales bacterium WSM2-2]